ncbi:MAG: dipeptidase, partial [Nitrospiraceae bacterium]
TKLFAKELAGRVVEEINAGKLVQIHTPPEIVRAQVQGRPGAILAVEGGDFLEGRIERVQEAYDKGIRSIQLVHYHINELGDIQTELPRHNGLTSFGAEVIREMNRLGMVVDLAHATFDMTKAAVEVTSRPVMLSHSLIGSSHPRLISKDHARLIAKTDGVIGAWAVRGPRSTFSRYIDHIEKLVDAGGIDHVGIGTDMDGAPLVITYEEWPKIPAALLARGYSRNDVAKVMGGNFMRMFKAVSTV